MVLREKDANAQILRNFIDFSFKPNQYFLTNLSRVMADSIDQLECTGQALRKVDTKEGVELLRRKYKLSNLEIAYILQLITRGFRFRVVTERVFLCEERAIYPNFESFPPIKPKISDDFETKTAVLDVMAISQYKEDEELLSEVIKSNPELLEKQFGVHYTGRYLSINEWLQLKENEGEWSSENNLRCHNFSITPSIIAEVLILQARGWYLQEIPVKFQRNEYILLKK